jgi:hypothetical protein
MAGSPDLGFSLNAVQREILPCDSQAFVIKKETPKYQFHFLLKSLINKRRQWVRH